MENLFEQVFHGDDALYSPCVLVEFQSVSRDEGQVEGVLTFGFLLECAYLVAQVLVVCGTDGEIILAEFHLTDVVDVVSSFYHQVYLGTIFLFPAFPRACLRLYPTDTKGLLDLW